MSHFSNVLIAALEHPDQDFREHLSNKIELWIRSKKPKHSKQSIEKAILECKGTLIEPFILRKKHFYISLILAMLAFTKQENQRVVRLMSEDTYGVYTGGCLLRMIFHSLIMRTFTKVKNQNTKKVIGIHAHGNTLLRKKIKLKLI